MAVTLSARKEGVSVDGKRTVTYTATFDDNSAADVTKATIGLTTVDAVYLKLKSSSGIAVDLTANDSTKITLDPSGAGSADIVIAGW